MKNKHIVLILLILISFLHSTAAWPWDNTVTHKDLSEYAAQNSVLSKNIGAYLKNLGFNKDLFEEFLWENENLAVIKWLF